MDLDLYRGAAAILGCRRLFSGQKAVILGSKLTADGCRGAEAKALDILAVYGAGSAITTIAFLVFCFRAVEAPYND